ncbi:MAG: hypothetical protein ABII82_12145 [Verrucomicrobiota bacterium]
MGCGKTTLCRHFLNQIDHKRFDTAPDPEPTRRRKGDAHGDPHRTGRNPARAEPQRAGFPDEPRAARPHRRRTRHRAHHRRGPKPLL